MAGEYDAHAIQRRLGTEDDYRGAFGRDRDRILYSSAFRRLAGKTQVLAAGELGDYHNRMTHSLKVAQLGRRLGQRLQVQAIEAGLADRDAAYPAPDPELIEAACLAHDLGHPPFGHAGEEALLRAIDRIVKSQLPDDASDEQRETAALGFGGFEGNAQTFRILVYLAARHPRTSRGLDLTRATLDATIKYPWFRGKTQKSTRKWNVYGLDSEVAEWVRAGVGLGEDTDKCFEAYVMDWCDDVTYACHDVEDFYRAGLIPLHELLAFPPTEPGKPPTADEPDALRQFLDFVAGKWESRGKDFDRDAAVAAWRDLGQLILIDGPYQGTRDSKAETHRATSQLITYFVSQVRWQPAGSSPCRHEARLVLADESARLKCDLLQELIWHFVINRPALASQQIGQQRIVEELLEIYYTCEDPRLLPVDRRREAEEHGDLLRACVDHVASLTEAEAIGMHGRLTGVRVGYHTDDIGGR